MQNFRQLIARFLFVISLAFLINPQTQADSSHSNPLGVGVILGQPTGLSVKYWLDTQHALDGGLAYSFNGYTLIFGDYLWHFAHAFSQKGSPLFVKQLTPYLGVGGSFFLSGSSAFEMGLRIPFGIEWRPSEPSLGVFVELVPGIGLVPGTFGFMQAGIGARFYF